MVIGDLPEMGDISVHEDRWSRGLWAQSLLS